MSIDPTTYRAIVGLLDRELVCALGCTEPIALAYGSALAAAALGEPAEHLHVRCSGNIIKNVKGVSVPNAEGMKGVECAAVLGCLVGDPERRLEVLEAVTHQDVLACQGPHRAGVLHRGAGRGGAQPLHRGRRPRDVSHRQRDPARPAHQRGRPGARRCARDLRAPGEPTCAARRLRPRPATPPRRPTCSPWRSSAPLPARSIPQTCARSWTVRSRCNSAIAREGLDGHWGSEVGRTIAGCPAGRRRLTRMRARSAAGSDARMGGCSLPVVINSGSGNQGMTVSLPVHRVRRDHPREPRGPAAGPVHLRTSRRSTSSTTSAASRPSVAWCARLRGRRGRDLSGRRHRRPDRVHRDRTPSPTWAASCATAPRPAAPPRSPAPWTPP